MSGSTVSGGVGRFLPDRRTLAWVALVLNAEFILVAGYYTLATDVTLRDPLFAVVPFVWLNLAGWAIVRTTPAPADLRKRRLAALVAAGYFLMLAYFGGVLGPGTGTGRAASVSLQFAQLPPGWNPALLYNGSVVSLVVLPYKLVGYVALAYLVYATALDAASALVGGVLGLFSCVSCTFPLLAGVVTGIVGSGSAVAGFTASNSYLLSTVVFAVTVVLLRWRPTPSFGRE
jgi:hypothetical protein